MIYLVEIRTEYRISTVSNRKNFNDKGRNLISIEILNTAMKYLNTAQAPVLKLVFKGFLYIASSI